MQSQGAHPFNIIPPQKGTDMENRLGVIGIIVRDRDSSADHVNHILSEFSDVIKGRMGLPEIHENVCAIALFVEGTNERIGALTGRLGQTEHVQVTSTYIKNKKG